MASSHSPAPPDAPAQSPLPSPLAAAPLIELHDASVRYGGKIALDRLSWSLWPGQHWALFGGNGAGKSTFLRLLRGELWPVAARDADDGETAAPVRPVRQWNFDGTPETSPLMARPYARIVSGELHRAFSRLCDTQGWSMPGFELVLSGYGDSFFPSHPSEEEKDRALAMARQLGAGALLDKGVGALSQGQLRLLLLARALVTAPRLLLLDEPFDGLDARARDAMRAAVEAAASRAALVCSAHRMEDIAPVVTHALCLEGGRSVYQGPLSGLPDISTLFPAGDPAASPVGFTAPPASPALADPAESPRKCASRSKQSVPVLELENVDVFIEREHILHGIHWRVLPGENWRISGANGSGKSTLLRLLAGLEQAAWGGTYRLFGKKHPPLSLVQKRLAYLSDRLQATYSYDLTGAELAATGFDGSVGIWRNLRRTEWEKVLHWLELLGLMHEKDTPLSRLSSGTARRFFLARALVGSPRILLLDEPCSGLDAPSRALFLSAVNSAAARGIQIIYVSHHDADIPACITHELHLKDGRTA
ncbi:ATP-binding cassette domain-containing protein [Desulfovibrio sp. OttesenSCG-928-I05]|nr:ATP-binding cassette domain-containing protein [Desulfovibrio sp. OttesenSCG-928-I05]